MKSRQHRLLNSLLGLVLCLGCSPVLAQSVLVFAAASTTLALNEVISKYQHLHPGVRVRASYAASSTLAKQIAAGAPAQIYLSANPGWMDYLQRQQRVVPDSRQPLLRNRLVLIAPRDQAFDVQVQVGFPLAERFDGRLCMGDPAHVPAGQYGQQALQSLGWWASMKPRIVGTKDVRASLAFVERGECAAGIVYATDAQGLETVVPLAVLAPDLHDPVTYPVALVQPSSSTAQAFLDFLTAPPAAAIFSRHGFTTAR